MKNSCNDIMEIYCNENIKQILENATSQLSSFEYCCVLRQEAELLNPLLISSSFINPLICYHINLGAYGDQPVEYTSHYGLISFIEIGPNKLI